MSLYNIANKNLTALTPTTFAAEGLQETARFTRSAERLY